MNGRPYRAVEHLSFPAAMVAEPRGEDVPTVRVSMPNDFEVEFCPTFPLSIGNALSVKAKRICRGQPKNDHTFVSGPNGWVYGAGSLSDDDLRSCLTPDGPRPA
jgi:hypothetical protein